MTLNIVMLYYNQPKYIKSVLKQLKQLKHLNDIELIIVDNGSKKPLIIKDTTIKLKIIRLNKSVNIGTARNISLNAITLPWFIVIDIDDQIYSAVLDELINLINNIKDSNICEIIPEYKAFINHKNKYSISTDTETCMLGHIFKTSFIKDNNINYGNLPFHEDIYFSLLCVNTIHKLKYQKLIVKDKCLYIYNQNNSESISNTMPLLKQLLYRQEAYKVCFDIINNENIENIDNNEFIYNLCCHITVQIYYIFLILKYIIQYHDKDLKSFDFVTKLKSHFSIHEIYNSINSLNPELLDKIYIATIKLFDKYLSINLYDSHMKENLKNKLSLLEWLKNQ